MGASSGVDVISDVSCRVLEGVNWKLILQNAAGNIFFIDEENAFINTEEFAAAVRGSDNYFVLITRENLYNLPYSVEEIYGLYEVMQQKENIKLYLPESFEWIILKAGLIEEKEIRKMLEEPEQYIDSKDYFSWERFFSHLLIEKTKDTYLQYRKTSLNKTYLHDKNKEKILRCMEGIQW